MRGKGELLEEIAEEMGQEIAAQKALAADEPDNKNRYSLGYRAGRIDLARRVLRLIEVAGMMAP